MGNLGSCFPQSMQDDYLDEHLVPGQVLYLYCPFTSPEKDKFLVLVAANANPKPLFFIINSEIPEFIQKRPGLKPSQVLVRASANTFLDYDSYVNCNEVKDYFNGTDIRQQLRDDISRVKGMLDRGTIQLIIKAVRKSKTIAQHHKRLILQNLEKLLQ